MRNCNVIAIDLAKQVFQVCQTNGHGKVLTNRRIKRSELADYLARQPAGIVAMEACGGAHYWGRVSQLAGHEVKLLSPRAVKPFRQGQKTDANDAQAIAVAVGQPGMKTVPLKNVDRQDLQSLERVRAHWRDAHTATSNLMRSLLAEFGIVFGKGFARLKTHIPLILEDGENGLPMEFRQTLAEVWGQWCALDEHLKGFEKRHRQRIEAHEPCRRLLALESVGPVNALSLCVSLGDGTAFKNGREAAACMGLTPQQHSSGGKTVLGGIGKRRGNQALRSSLVQGARAVIQVLAKREAKTAKERWLKELIARRGQGRAAVALANKTVRTAWALLRYNREYRQDYQLAV